MRSPARLFALFALAASALLSGCDQLGIEPASAVAARRESEGKAVGAGCRHAGRAIEDCYALNRRADKGAVYAGWREMNDYMRENKIEEVAPSVQPPAPIAAKAEPEPAAPEPPAPKAAKPGKS